MGAYIDSYYEYMWKSCLLLGDPELKAMWDASIGPVRRYLPDARADGLWFAQVNKNTGAVVSHTTNVWDAYFPGLLALSGDLISAARHQDAWDSAWRRYGMLPERFDYVTHAIETPTYTLNPEIMESAWYLSRYTHDPKYKARVWRYYQDLRRCCRTDTAYTVANAATGKQGDLMETFFIAETLKYIWLTFAGDRVLNPNEWVLSTEAQPFRRADFHHAEAARRLGYAPTFTFPVASAPAS